MSQPIQRAPVRIQQAINQSFLKATEAVHDLCPQTAQWLTEKKKIGTPAEDQKAIINQELTSDPAESQILTILGNAIQKLREENWSDAQIELAIQNARI